MKNNIVLVAPTVEPLTTAEAKAQLNIDPAFTDDDTFIDTLIVASRVWCENRTGQCCIKQQRVQYMDYFPLYDFDKGGFNRIHLGGFDNFSISHGPVLLTGTGVIAPVIKYYDSLDVEQTWADTNYWLDTRRFEPMVMAKYSWPSVGFRPSSVSVTYFAGFGVDATTVPANIKSAMKLIISHMYNNRTPEVENGKGDFARIEFGIDRMLAFDTRIEYAGKY